MTAPQSYSFGSFRLLPVERLLTRNGKPLPLTPKVFDTLLLLVERRGRLVEKEELMELLWPGVFVNENNLNKNVSVLRKALRNGTGDDEYIETVPKRGYRFVGEVTTEELIVQDSPAAAAPRRRGRSYVAAGAISITVIAAVILIVASRPGARPKSGPRQIHSIAVLPFRRIDGNDSNRYLGLALADSLIDRLGYARTYAVRPTSSIQRYVDGATDALTAARELGVDGVVEGTIQQSGTRMRVTVALISAADRTPVWSGKFDDGTGDVFELEDLVGGAVARALSSTEPIPPPGHRPPPDAYDAFLRGRYYISARGPGDIANAVKAYREAIRRDDGFAAAHAGEAEALILSSLYRELPPSESFPRAKAEAMRALALDPSLAEGHGCLGAASFYYDHDARGTERELLRAIALKPQYHTARRWYANYLTACGRFDDAIAQIRAAQSADPQSLMLRSVLGWHLFMARRYDQAIDQLQRTLDIDSSFVPAIHSLALAYVATKRYDEAIALFEKEANLAGESFMVADMARLYALRGERPVAEAYLRRAEELARQKKVMAYDVASVYGVLGDDERATEWLATAIAAHESGIVWLDVDPRMDSARRAPKFAALARTCTWRESSR